MSNVNFNLDAILKAAGSERGAMFKPPKESKHQVRILPSAPLFYEAFRHWNIVDGKTVRSTGKNCPASVLSKFYREQAEQFQKGSEMHTRLVGWPRGMAGQIRLDSRVFYNVIVRFPGEDNLSVQWVALPWGKHKDLFDNQIPDQIDSAKTASVDWNMFDPEMGNDVILGYHPQTKRGDKIWSITISSQQTPIGLDGWEDQLHDLEEVATKNMIKLTDEEIVAKLSAKHDPFLKEAFKTSVEEVCGVASSGFMDASALLNETKGE